MSQDEAERTGDLPERDEREAEGGFVLSRPALEDEVEPEAALPAAVMPSVQTAQATLKERRREGLRPGQQSRRQMKVGRVVSDKMDKTVIVVVEYTRPHPIYKKAMKRSSKFAAHDERNECRIGDVVRIEEARPLSKTKRWVVREVVQRRVAI
jgi:small subunit ribosomal protein S17